MAQSREERLYWRDDEWLNEFFDDFANELHHCSPNRLEPNIQNTDEYNDTRDRCKFILEYYLSRLNRIVSDMETTQLPIPIEIINNVRTNFEEIIQHDVFHGITDERSEELGQPMAEGDHQHWSEVGLVNRFNELYELYLRLIRFLNDRLNQQVEGGGRKKYKKNKKVKKSRKTKKSRKARKTRRK